MWTSTCSSCSFRMTSTGATSVIERASVHSRDIGTHTCTASRGGDSASDSIVFNVVGEWLLTVFHCTCMYVYICSDFDVKHLRGIPQHFGMSFRACAKR